MSLRVFAAVLVLGCSLCVAISLASNEGDSPEAVESSATSEVVVDSSDNFDGPNPFVEQERIPRENFQDLVVRAERAKKASEDTTLPQNVRDFSKAAVYFYSRAFDSAYAMYDTLRLRDAALERSVVLRMAKIRFLQGDYVGMRETLAKPTKSKKDAQFEKVSARMRIEAALLDSTLDEKAHSDSLKVYLNKYPKGDDAAALKFRYAVSLEKQKNPKEAKRYYMQLLASNTAYRDSAFKAIEKLRKFQVTPESLSEKVGYAKIACGKEEAAYCLAMLDSIQMMDSLQVISNPETIALTPDSPLLKNLPTSTLDYPTRVILWEKRADALRSLKRDEESIAQYRFLIDTVESRTNWVQTILKLYRNNSAKYEKEIAEMDAKIQDANKFSTANLKNLWLRGFEFEQEKKYDSAVVYFKSLDDNRFGTNVRRQWAKFRVGFIYFKQEKWEEAAEYFKAATKDKFLWSGSGSRMFLGDTYMKMGKDSLAREAYLDCIRDFPLSYYAHRSREKLVEYNLMDKSKVPYAHGVQKTPEETMDWIRSIQKLSKQDSASSAERYNRIKYLFLYGFSDEAFALFNEANKKNAKRLDFLYEYGNLFYEVGEIAAGYRLARQFQSHMDRHLLMEPPIDVLHFLFPTPFKNQVKYHSGKKIDPFFVYSVMRQESTFDFEIVSPAKAIGLLQIIPPTGKSLAKLENIEDFDPSMLYNPYMNIRLGVRYLVDLKAEYKDDYMYVLSNYNAGPKPAKRWQAAGADLTWDVRAEEISYWETRDYVKRVMGNYWIYQEIYDKL